VAGCVLEQDGCLGQRIEGPAFDSERGHDGGERPQQLGARGCEREDEPGDLHQCDQHEHGQAGDVVAALASRGRDGEGATGRIDPLPRGWWRFLKGREFVREHASCGEAVGAVVTYEPGGPETYEDQECGDTGEDAGEEVRRERRRLGHGDQRHDTVDEGRRSDDAHQRGHDAAAREEEGRGDAVDAPSFAPPGDAVRVGHSGVLSVSGKASEVLKTCGDIIRLLSWAAC